MHKGEAIDVHKLLSKIPFTTTGIPNELHIPNHRFAGPNTRLDLRLNEDDTPKDWSMPIDRDDHAAYIHDLKYRDAGDDLSLKHAADRLLIDQLNAIKDPSLKEKLDRLIIKTAINAKLAFGLGFENESLQTREKYADEIHKQFMKPRNLLKVQVDAKDDIWSADLINVPSEQGYKYILTVIDLYTRYA
jgi:hypothetical protein